MEEHPSDLKKYRRGLVSSELLSETEVIFLLETKGQQPASSFRAACGQGGRAVLGARAAGSKGRGAAGSATCSRWRTSGARSSSSGSLTGRWPHSPLADEGLPLGSQSLSVVAALRSAGGLLRRGSGQLKVGLLVLGLAREQQCNAPVRTG